MFSVIRGEYPFNEVIGVVTVDHDKPEQALLEAKQQFARDVDFFKRHPVVEPIEVQ